MSAGPLDTTKYNNMVNNAAARVKISSTVFKAFIADVKEKIDDNYAVSASVTQQAVINGNFPANQRMVSGTVTLTAGQYGHDRWKAGASGCTYTFATSNNVTTITITAGSLIQAIEGINLYSGTYTLSWTGTAQGKIGAGSFSASGVTGAVVGGTNTNIEFNTGTLSKVQLNVGSLALPFQPRSYAEEIELCLRHTWIPQGSANVQARMNTANSNLLVFEIPLSVQLRATPTIRGIVNTDYKVYSISNNFQAGFTSAAVLTSTGVRVTMTKNGHGLTDGYLDISSLSGFDAEL